MFNTSVGSLSAVCSLEVNFVCYTSTVEFMSEVQTVCKQENAETTIFGEVGGRVERGKKKKTFLELAASKILCIKYGSEKFLYQRQHTRQCCFICER